MIQIDIFSDPICPWCYIGATYLERALAAWHAAQIAEGVQQGEVALRWHPFQLNPDMPPEGMDRRAYLEAKFGGQAGALKVYGEIARRAEDAGIPIDFAAIKRTPSTLDAHRLIHWAGLEGRQTPLAEALFAAYFTQGRDIGDHATLADIAADLGMDRALVARLLDSDADMADIRASDAEAREMGMTGVPTFIVAKKYVLSGAQPTDMWQRLLADLVAQGAQGDDETPDEPRPETPDETPTA